MKPSNLRKEIHEYVDHADQRFLALVYSMVQAEKNQYDLDKESALSASLDRALQQVEEGKVTPHNEVRKKYEKWL